MTGERPCNRWLIAAMGTLLQLCLGTVYAWSFFQKLLMEAYGWSNAQVAWSFSLAIGAIGLAAAWGGVQLPRLGPRRLATAGGLLFGAGHLVAALALHLKALPLLYLGYGVIAGTGLGLGYVTPVATVAKWFPDRKGLATGMVIMGFGFGALLMSKVLAPVLLAATGRNLVAVFAILGLLFTALMALAASFMRNPPGAPAPGAAAAAPAASGPTARTCIVSSRFAAIWAVFFCNIAAGISIIGFQSPLMQDLRLRADPALGRAALEAAGATLIALSSIFNGLGRFVWGWVSDRIGRTNTFRAMLATQAVAMCVLPRVEAPWLFAALICYVLLCYGGGFGTMPALVLDTFGSRVMAVVYGTVLTAWSAAGIIGPQIVAAIKDRFAAQASTYAFLIGACFLAAGLALSVFLRDRPFAAAGPEGRHEQP